jgi:cytochrome bd-type quinol oxidase subunit 1
VHTSVEATQCIARDAFEASFFGVLLFGRNRVRPGFYLFSTAMVALGTTLSAFWIMVNNSWMQYPVGYTIQDGVYAPVDWAKIIFGPVGCRRAGMPMCYIEWRISELAEHTGR